MPFSPDPPDAKAASCREEGSKLKTLRYGFCCSRGSRWPDPASFGEQSSEGHEKLIGAWHLALIDSPEQDRKRTDATRPPGMLIYTNSRKPRATARRNLPVQKPARRSRQVEGKLRV
jgi:hypothetical protein